MCHVFKLYWHLRLNWSGNAHSYHPSNRGISRWLMGSHDGLADRVAHHTKNVHFHSLFSPLGLSLAKQAMLLVDQDDREATMTLVALVLCEQDHATALFFAMRFRRRNAAV
jgi:hypothetical protein